MIMGMTKTSIKQAIFCLWPKNENSKETEIISACCDIFSYFAAFRLSVIGGLISKFFTTRLFENKKITEA